ncbi:MAG: 4a-hydroxytetrahydrobiopterin dehydratase [Actinomycetota bacterium]
MAPPQLSEDEVTQALAGLTDWHRDGDHIRAEFRFADFGTAMGFMVQAGYQAERRNHHPEWSNVYNRVSVGLTTHDSGGLTQLDVDLATVMSQVAAALNS